MSHRCFDRTSRTGSRRSVLAGPLVAALAVLVLAVLPRAQAQQDDPVKFHHGQSSPKVDYQALFDAATPLAESAEGQALLESCLQAYGGRDKLADLESFRLTFKLDGSDPDTPPSIVRSFERGRRYKVVEGEKARILNDRRCWVQDAVQSWEMEDYRYRAELYSYLVLAMPLAAEQERFDEIRYAASGEEALGLFYFVKSDSLMLIMGVDPEDHLIKTTTGVLPDGERNNVYVNRFSDFGSEGGYLFPHRLTNFSLGMKMGEHVLEKVEIAPRFGADEFLPRGEGK